MELVELKKHPAWKNAVEKILEKFEAEGYGCFISDDEFVSWMSLDIQNVKTIDDFKRYNCSMLQRYAAIDQLLADYDMCLQRVRGSNGFQILTPSDQITKGYDHRMTKLRKELNKLTKTITNVKHEFLSLEEERDRQLKILKGAMVKSALNKRKLELPTEEKKLIGLKN